MQRVLLRPQVIGDLTFARTTSESLYGPIVCNWERDGGQVKYEIEVPPNTTAELRLRSSDGTVTSVELEAGRHLLTR